MRDPVNDYDSISFDGGVNLLDHPLALRPNQLVRSANAFPNINGILEKRPGVTASMLLDVSGVATNKLFVLQLKCVKYNGTYKYAHQTVLEDNFGAATIYVGLTNLPKILSQNSLIDDGLDDQNNSKTVVDSYPVSILQTNGKILFVGRLSLINTIYAAGVVAPQLFTSNLDENTQLLSATFEHPVTTGVPDAQTQTIPITPKLACIYRGRARYFNFGPGMEHWMVVADSFKLNHTNTTNYPISTVVGDDVLSINGRHVEFEKIANEEITLAAEIMLSQVSSPIQSALLVCTQEHALICTGDITQSSDTDANTPNLLLGDFEANKVNYKVGCCGHLTFVETPYGYIWASQDDVWTLVNNTPVKIGTLISKALAAYPPEVKHWWSAAYHDNKYILQCVTSSEGDHRYLQREQWWLNLADGMPKHYRQAKWYGPMSVVRDAGQSADECALSCITTDDDNQRVIGVASDNGFTGTPTRRNHLIDYTSGGTIDDRTFLTTTDGLEWTAATAYTVGDIIRPSFFNANGRLYVCTTAGTTAAVIEPSWTNADGAVMAVDGTVVWTEILGLTGTRLLNKNGGTEYFTNAIDVRTKEFQAGNPILDKIIKRLDLVAYYSQLGTMWANLIKNQGATGQFNAVLGLYGQGINQISAGVDQLDTTPITGNQLESKSLRPIPNKIIRGKSMQVQLRDGYDSTSNPNRGNFYSGGYVIDSTCNSLVFGAVNTNIITGAEAKLIQATIPLNSNGYQSYDNIELLTVALVDAMNDALAGNDSILTLDYSPNPWSTNNPSQVSSPYVNQLYFAYNGRNVESMVFFLGDQDDYDLSGFAALGNPATSYDLLASKKLMAMLGFYTNNQHTSLVSYGGPSDIHFTPESPSLDNGSHLTMTAIEITPYKRSAKIATTGGTLVSRTTKSKSLTFKNK